MKTKVSLKMFVLSVVLLMTSFVASARSYDGQLVYNPVEENGVMVGQTVYKMNGSTLANYMKYNYKYDEMEQYQRGMGKRSPHQLYIRRKNCNNQLL